MTWMTVASLSDVKVFGTIGDAFWFSFRLVLKEIFALFAIACTCPLVAADAFWMASVTGFLKTDNSVADAGISPSSAHFRLLYF